MFENETITFVSEDELRQPVPPGTIVHAQVRRDRDGELGNFKSGDSGFGPWMLVPFEVIDGPFRGTWASLMLNIKGSDRRFRAVFEAVTGVDLSAGASVSFADFKHALLDNTFEVEMGPEKRKGEATGFTAVHRVLRGIGSRVEPQATLAPTLAIEQAPRATSRSGSDEDIPF